MAVDLGKQVGPLPLGAWIAVVGGGLGLAYYTTKTQNKEPEVVEDVSGDPGVGNGAVGGWVPTTPGNTDPVPPAITTNEQWGVAAINWLIAQGYDASVSDSAIRKYLAANEPKPSVQEFALQRMALARFGSPPQPLPPSANEPPTSTPPITQPPPNNQPPNNPPPAKPTYKYEPVKAWPAKTSTLWGMAEKWYGNGAKWRDIYAANRSGVKRADGKMGFIKDPNKLYVSMPPILIPGK